MGQIVMRISSRARKCGPVQHLVAVPTQCDEVGLRVVTEVASSSYMMDIQIPERPTLLAAPTIAIQDHATQRRIKPRHRSNSRPSLRT